MADTNVWISLCLSDRTSYLDILCSFFNCGIFDTETI